MVDIHTSPPLFLLLSTMLAYYYEENDEDKTAPHRGEECPLTELDKVGVLYGHGDLAMVDALAAERGYVNRDVVRLDAAAPGVDKLLDTFFVEHQHEDEEIRYILEGSGYFDVRSVADRWVRVRLERGDLLVLPPGLFHRFTLAHDDDHDSPLVALRLFQAEPNWVAHPRER